MALEQAWSDKGVLIVYVTGRPEPFGKISIRWEVQFWICIDAITINTCIAKPSVQQLSTDGAATENWNPPTYWGLVDTRNYPGRGAACDFPSWQRREPVK